MPTLALIAHDAKKAELADWVARHKVALAHSQIVCTANTGRLVQSVSQGLAITFVKSGPLGGDQQIGALIATGKIDALIFFPDPLTPMPHDVDVKALLRLALVYNLPSAYNVASADMIISALRFDR